MDARRRSPNLDGTGRPAGNRFDGEPGFCTGRRCEASRLTIGRSSPTHSNPSNRVAATFRSGCLARVGDPPQLRLLVSGTCPTSRSTRGCAGALGPMMKIITVQAPVVDHRPQTMIATEHLAARHFQICRCRCRRIRIHIRRRTPGALISLVALRRLSARAKEMRMEDVDVRGFPRSDLHSVGSLISRLVGTGFGQYSPDARFASPRVPILRARADPHHLRPPLHSSAI
ncbi:uncharacterized protein N7459_003568 [Penicillium hispanicum]|uniref:uncharacterized protein n=1 Tax=Penicillium hispanicum TaxID=1080232 RepID=UPI00253FA967|nr:uncharacterized protein N7459_003568 [Penicillium hispanicum]KAJ5587803.1 hypothetical protein N7459_003568 [Penicillium hispanicum]